MPSAEMQHLEVSRAETFLGHVEGCVPGGSSLGRPWPNLEALQGLKNCQRNLTTIRLLDSEVALSDVAKTFWILPTP